MLRKLLNNALEITHHSPTEAVCYPHPFTKPETSVFGWLTNVAPCFPVKQNSIRIITEPKQFFNTLIELSKAATYRITIASLYLGTGELEKRLVHTVLNNKNFTESTLKINILLDFTRGSRYENNSRTMLQPLLEKNEQNCNVSLYHTPMLRGLLKKYMPNRYNELIGLQHMKLYIFDDTLVISGANLSNDYFTNRQDRYYIIQDKKLTDFYSGLVTQVQSFSLKLSKCNNVSLNENWSILPYEGDKNEFIKQAGDLVEQYLHNSIEERNSHREDGFDTWIFPTIQMGQLGINQDEKITSRIFSEAKKGATIKIASEMPSTCCVPYCRSNYKTETKSYSIFGFPKNEDLCEKWLHAIKMYSNVQHNIKGYFNLTSQYMNTLIEESKANCDILMAHPKANGFLGAKGPAGGIPFAYSLIAKQFQERLSSKDQQFRIKLLEYAKEGWTYHAKGLWFYPKNSKLPCLTLVGSPNFGERSVKKDLESQLCIVTENEDLKKELHKECQSLYQLGKPADLNRKVPAWVHFFVTACRSYF